MFSTAESTSNVPAFLLKLWTLVEDKSCNDLIGWDHTGKSFHVTDQARFAKEVLPHYFKHNNISSFIRQLNMYGFRKVGAVEQGALKVEKDDVEFQHQFFRKGEHHLLENIKRRTSNPKNDSVKYLNDDVNELIVDVQSIKGKQNTVSTKLDQLRNENEVLWREVANLRQKHAKQQQIVNKLIQFLVTLAGGNRGLSGMKRKMQLMIEEPGTQTSNKIPKLNRPLSITEPNTTYTVESPSSYTDSGLSGPTIHDVTDAYHHNNTNNNMQALQSRNTTVTSTSDPLITGNVLSPNNLYSPVQPQSPSDQALAISAGNTRLPNNQYSFTNDNDSQVLKPETYKPDSLLLTQPSVMTGGTLLPPPPPPQPQQPLSSSATSTNSTSTAVCSTSNTCPKAEVHEYIDLTEKDLEGLKDYLSSGQLFNLDSNLLMGLFTPDSPLPQIPDNIFDAELRPSPGAVETPTTGNELTEFNANDMPLSLFDLQDDDHEDYNNVPNFFDNDGLNTPQIESTNPLKNISTDDLD